MNYSVVDYFILTVFLNNLYATVMFNWFSLINNYIMSYVGVRNEFNTFVSPNSLARRTVALLLSFSDFFPTLKAIG